MSLGSSPRPRGTQRPLVARLRALRFIPASAGNTCQRREYPRRTPVHPRVRGEHIVLPPCPRVLVGSSPRPRGTPAPHRPRYRRRRFIPASAGNTRAASSTRSTPPVHPRVRGEHASPVASPYPSPGSSPRPRGTRYHVANDRAASRFIPASAGNTKRVTYGQIVNAVHPRVRGEHVRSCWASDGLVGSSPRPRGTQSDKALPTTYLRFIPASAGNTAWLNEGAPAQPVHPRVRGEHTLMPSAFVSVGRFIPASTGNTSPEYA